MAEQDNLLDHLRGPFNFLDPSIESIRLHHARLSQLLPRPRPIFLRDGAATPVMGFPVQRNRSALRLAEALRLYIESEERAQVATLTGGAGFDLRSHQMAWSNYREQLEEVSENLFSSNYGRSFPQIFWLDHSRDLVTILRGTPSRIRRLDLQIGKRRGEQLRYTVLFKFLQRVIALCYDLAARISRETGQTEEELFPPILTLMQDNVLILTEDHVGRELEELVGYFRGYLKIDGRSLLYRVALLRSWHRETLAADPFLRRTAETLHPGSDEAPDSLLHRQGYLDILSGHPGYDPAALLGPPEIRLWSALLEKLKEFELLNATRRLIVEVTASERGYLCPGSAAKRLGLPPQDVELFRETRPLDFSAPWIIDPEVSRVGLIYDITEFSAIVSIVRLADRASQNDSYRQIFTFQHRINQIARLLRLRIEKYLGDGAFYSGRNPLRMLIAALRMQRAYAAAVADGFPFDRGMRLALNFGSYRLLPLGGSNTTEEERYEVYGHGLVELSRLVSGKKGLDFEEIKSVLIARGYDELAVNDFFAPVTADSARATFDRAKGEFFAELSRDGALVNEGIVATERFLEELQRSRHLGPLFKAQRDDRSYVVVAQPAGPGERQLIAVRRLGLARLKGLDKLSVYEVLDATGWELKREDQLHRVPLVQAINESFTASLARAGRPTPIRPL